MKIILLQSLAVPLGLSILDWIVLAAYASAMLLIGWFYSRKNKTQEDYLLGGRKMNPSAIGISLFATLFSTLSYLAYPSEMIQNGPAIFAGVAAYPLVYYVAGWWLIPRIMSLKVTSAYEILEMKLGLSVRVMATSMFLSLRLLWMATLIYVTVDVAIMSVSGLDPSLTPFVTILLIVIVVIYTSMGGLRAVVVTDLVQAGIFLGGALLSAGIVCAQFGSLSVLFPTEWPEHWDKFRWGFDAQQRTTLGNAMLTLFTWYICTTGSDQMALQRYLSTRDITSARKSLKVSLCTDVTASVLLALIGLSMLAFFGNQPGFVAEDLYRQADTLFPRFILVALPAGISGLVIAGLVGAAMSSMSAGVNSVATVISEDFLKRFIPKRESQGNPLRNIKLVSSLVGVAVLVLTFLVRTVQGNLLDVIMKVVNLFVAPLFVLFFMALFVPFATERGALIGGLVATGVAIAIAFFGTFGITVLWIMPTALLAGVVAGVIVSRAERWLYQPAHR